MLTHGSAPSNEPEDQEQLVRVRTFVQDCISIQVRSERSDGATLHFTITDSSRQAAAKRVRIRARPHGVYPRFTASSQEFNAAVATAHRDNHLASMRKLEQNRSGAPGGAQRPDPMNLQREHQERKAVQNRLNNAQRELRTLTAEYIETITHAFPTAAACGLGDLPLNGWFTSDEGKAWRRHSHAETPQLSWENHTGFLMQGEGGHSMELSGLRSGGRYECAVEIAFEEVRRKQILSWIKLAPGANTHRVLCKHHKSLINYITVTASRGHCTVVVVAPTTLLVDMHGINTKLHVLIIHHNQTRTGEPHDRTRSPHRLNPV